MAKKQTVKNELNTVKQESHPVTTQEKQLSRSQKEIPNILGGSTGPQHTINPKEDTSKSVDSKQEKTKIINLEENKFSVPEYLQQVVYHSEELLKELDGIYIGWHANQVKEQLVLALDNYRGGE